jgi:acyl-CoA synthetase (AMP-forming)/AMP-acid ligase II
MTCARDEASPALDYGGPVDLPFELFADSVLDGSIIDRFDAIVRRFASRLAIQDDSRSLTYADLAGLVDRIAGVTAGATAGRTGPVALLLANDARYPAAMLGVLAAGRAYIPLDPENPIERNVLITTRSGAAALISAGALANDCRTEFPHDLPVIDVEAMSRGPQADRQVRPRPNDVAHIVYTSGSTGAPKGAFHDHRSCLHEVLQTTNKLHLGPVDRLALFYPPTVMGGIRTTYAALLNGASLHILPARTLGPAGLLQATRSRRITVYRSVPSLFRRIVEALEPDQQLDDLRAVYLAGDQFGWSDVDAFRRGSSRNVFIGIGVGSTECPSNYIQWFIDDKYREADARPSDRVAGA